MPTLIQEVRSRALRALIPPPRRRLSQWIEQEVRLPLGATSTPGPVRLWPLQVAIADAIGDPEIPRVTVMKPAQVGLTTLIAAAIAGWIGNDPAPSLVVLPRDDDCRTLVNHKLDPLIGASPAVAGALSTSDGAGRRSRGRPANNTMMERHFAGGFLRVVSARSPNNLRGHSVRYLLLDEVDGMTMTAEGHPVDLAEKRTANFDDSKFVLSSTPALEETSAIYASYLKSDQRIYEVRCPECLDFFGIDWVRDIHWPEGRPEEAYCACPHCGSVLEERLKGEMVANGRWRAQRPEVTDHAGFAFSALISNQAKASWGVLARQFVASKGDPAARQAFQNLVLGLPWKTAGETFDEGDLAARAEAFGLESLPEDVLLITAGCDVQDDRVEVVTLGHAEGGKVYVLAHEVVWGRYTDNDTWSDVDKLLSRKFPHPLGGRIGYSASAVDSGDGEHTDTVMSFARGRRRIHAIKGMPGNRRPVEASKSKGSSLFILGVDVLKRQLFQRLPRPEMIAFSDALSPVFYDQLTSERMVTRHPKGRPTITFERITGRRAEVLDGVVYALAMRELLGVPNWAVLKADAASPEGPIRTPKAKPKAESWVTGGVSTDHWFS